VHHSHTTSGCVIQLSGQTELACPPSCWAVASSQAAIYSLIFVNKTSCITAEPIFDNTCFWPEVKMSTPLITVVNCSFGSKLVKTSFD